MKKTHLLLGSALVLGGCGAAHGTREPNEYEQQRLDRLALIKDAGRPTLESLVRSARVPFFDGDGNTISVDEFIELIDTVYTKYRAYYESGRIRISTDDTTEDDEKFGATLREAHNEQKNVIAFSAWLDPVLWTVGQEDHEIGHGISTLDNSLPEHGHSSTVDDATDGSITNLAEITWQNKDLPYALSLLNGPMDEAMAKAEGDAIFYRKEALEKVRTGELTSEQAVDYFESWHTAALAEPWSVTATAEFNDDLKNFMGWTDDEMIGAFDAGTLYALSEQDWGRIGGELEQELAEIDEAKRELEESKEKPTDRNYNKPGPERSELLSRR